MPKKLRIHKRLSDDALLSTRVCDLQLKIENSKIHRCIRDLQLELKQKGFRFKPYFWVSDEFFTPDGVPGIAIPFYLTNPRLEKLERKQMYEAEGSNYQNCMKILRHELGHAIDHAYRLRRKKERQKIFGHSSQKYPELYSPKPYSKSFVVHLDNWYAQSHPDEDFAETFAVWFRPGSRWKSRYRKWPAIKKLEYMDELMNSIKDKAPPIKTRVKDTPYTQIRKTLREYYEEKKDRFGLNTKEDFYDRELLKLFSNDPKHQKKLLATRFIRKNKRLFRQSVAKWTGQYSYSIDEVIEEIIERCDELELRLMLDEKSTQQEFLVLLSVQTMNYLHTGGYALAL